MAHLFEVHFKVKFYTQLSEQVKLIGNLPQLGAWDPNRAISLTTNPELYPFWMSTRPILLKKGAKLEFKFAIFSADNQLKRWENLPCAENRLYRVLYFKVILECSEGSFSVSENVLQKFLSNDILPGGIGKVKKRVQESDDDFNPFKAAQDFSFSDESFSSSDLRSDESPRVPNMQDSAEEGKGELLESDESTQMHNARKIVKNIEAYKKVRHNRDDDLEKLQPMRKPYFREDFDKQKTIPVTIRTKSLLQNIEIKDDIFTKIYDKMTAEKKIVKDKSLSLVQAFEEHNYFSAQQLSKVKDTIQAKVLVATCRLPFIITFNQAEPTKEKRWEIEVNYSLYASMIHFFGVERSKDITLFGWVGVDVPDEYQHELEGILKENYQAVPIFLPAELREKYIDGYCQNLLFNTFYNIHEQASRIDQSTLIESYRRVNQIFADKLLEYREESSNIEILINDYHLLLVPKYIALSDPKQVIGFIFETPFPSIEAFSAIEHQEELVKSVLCCDMICFNAIEYLKAFYTVCSKILSLKFSSEKGGHLFLNYFGRRVYLYISNRSIEPQMILPILQESEYVKTEERVKEQFLNCIVLLCVTHFHPSEALAAFLDAMMEFFVMNSHRKYKLLLLQSKGRILNETSAPVISEYKNTVIHKIVKINETLFHKQIGSSIEVFSDCTKYEKYAFVSSASIFFSFATTLTADFAAFEYVLVRCSGPAAIVRSIWTLDQKNLNIVMKVNPHNKKQVLQIVSEALAKPKEDQEVILNIDKELIQKCTAWNRFELITQDLSKLISIKSSMNLMSFKDREIVNVIAQSNQYRQLDYSQVGELFTRAKNSLIIINYENVLLSPQSSNDRRMSTQQDAKAIRLISKEQIELIRKISKAVDGQLYIISSKRPDRLNYLSEHLSMVSILAENGFLYKVSRESAWHQLFPVDWSFKTIVHKIMQNYVKRTEGTRIECKESSICWNFENVKTPIREIQVEEMKSHLKEVLQFLDYVEILCGDTWIEVKPLGINKGIATDLVLARSSLQKGPIDFVLCIGADSLDEEMYLKLTDVPALAQEGILAENADIVTVSVGKKPSNANYYVNHPADVYSLFKKLVELLED